MGAGVDPGAARNFCDNHLGTNSGCRATGPGRKGSSNRKTVTMTKDAKRTYRTIRGGKTSEVRPEVQNLTIDKDIVPGVNRASDLVAQHILKYTCAIYHAGVQLTWYRGITVESSARAVAKPVVGTIGSIEAPSFTYSP